MSIIHILDRQTDRILDDITEKYILENVHEQSLKDTLESFEFVTFGDKPFSKYLEKRNKIIIPLEDEGYQEFVISETDKNHEDETNEITVYCDASYLELKKLNPIEPQTFEDYTASTALAVATRNTPWQVGIVESSGTRTFSFDEYTNPFEFIKKIAKEFELEVKFRVEVDGNRIIGRFVDLVKRIGQYHGVEVEFGKNLKGIRRIENTDEVYTALIGLGPAKEDGTRAVAFVYDNDALQRWGIRDKNGNLQHLIGVHEVQSENTEMTPDEVARYTKIVLDRRTNAVVEYEGSLHDLEHVPGLQNKKIRFGDTIRIKDTKFNPPLYLEARIHTLKRDIVDKSKKDVVLGDYIEYTEDEVRAVWRQLQKEINRKIDLYQLLEYTYDKATIDKKDQIILGDGKEYSRNVAKEAEDNAKEHADSVAREAERLAKEYADQEINASESRILEATVAKAIFEATIDDILDDLAGKASNSVVQELQEKVASKVDGEWVEGRLATKADADSVYTIQEIDNMFDNVVSITEYTTDKQGFLETLENHESRISQTETEITTKVERTEFEAIEKKVGELGISIENAWTEINQHADEIALKASQSSVDTLSKEVSELEAQLTIQAGKIASKVDQSEFDSVTNTLGNRIATVEQTAEGIRTEVSDIRANVYTKSEVDSAIDNIQVGSRNFLMNGDFSKTYKGNPFTVDGKTYDTYPYLWGGYNSGIPATTYHAHIDDDTFGYNVVEFNETNGERNWKGIHQRGLEKRLSLTQTGIFTISVDVYATGTGTRLFGGFYYYRKSDGKRGFHSGQFNIKPTEVNKWVRMSAQCRLNDDVDFSKDISFYIYGYGFTTNSILYIKNVKLEYGNKATDWTPSIEDADARFGDIEGTLESHSTKIEQNAQQIQLRATKAEVDTLTGRVNQAESKITQLAGQIELRATKTEVDALTGRVSTVESTIQQHADMIQQKIDDGQARSIFRQEADSFTFDANQINFKGHVFGEDAIFMGSIGTPMLTVGAEDITGYENFGLRLQTAQWQPDVNEPFRKTGHIEFNTLNNGLEIIKYNLDHSTGYLDYFEVYARAFRIWGDVYLGGSGWVYTAAIDFPVGYAPGENIYLRPANSDAEVRATVTGTTNQYVDMRARTFLAGGTSGNGTFTTESGYVVLRAGDNDSIAYIQSNREVRATKRMQGSSYVPVRASSFPTGSLEEFKTNIKKWEESALAIIRDSDIYEFQLKNDLENGKIKTRYGLVIGEGYNTPEEVIDGDGIELYAMNSISWKAIQELDREQKDLKSRIAWLEAENERLMQKIKYLEGKIA